MEYSGAGPNYESFYQGGYSSLNPEYGAFAGYRLPAGKLAQTTNPSTANQLDETVKTLKTGVKEIEIEMLGINDVDQQIPKQHFKEMRALMKMSGVKASLHGPVIDPAGYGQQGADELERINTERRFVDAMEKAHTLNPSKGENIPVVFHASNGMPGSIYSVDKSKKPGEEGRLVMEKDFAINQDTGQATPLKREKKYYPGAHETFKEGGIEQGPLQQLNTINATEWENKMTELAQFNKHANEIIGSAPNYFKDYQNTVMTKNGPIDIETREKLPDLTPQQDAQYKKMHDADIFLENVSMNFTGAFNKAYEYGSEEQKKELVKLSENYEEDMNKIHENEIMQPVKKQVVLKNAITHLNNITSKQNPKTGKRDENFRAPQLFQRSHDYALKKSSETFSNVALDSYKQFKKEMPIMAIENWAPGTAFNNAEDLRALVEETRKKFAEKLHKKNNISMSRAKKIAEKQIGATWDVGHLNMNKKYGLTDEDIIKQTEAIAPVLKHLHLTDNFGFSDSHLVPGMGNVPFKQHLEKLEKAGVLEKVRKVVEAGGFIEQISKRGAHGETMAAFSSGIYGAKMAPYWNQAQGMMGNYFGGYGNTNPPTHHNVYGAGFTTLPTELGGNIPGGGSRFSGNSIA